MNTLSKNRGHDEASIATTSGNLPPQNRGNNKEEHDNDGKPCDIIAQLTEKLHKISFGEKEDASTKDLPRITSSSQLKKELPAICNEVFRVLGQYNREATYQRALAWELQDRGVTVLIEKEIAIEYKGKRVGSRRLDLYLELEKPVILELKAVATVGNKTEGYLKQLRFYMTHFHVGEGYLINFPHSTGFPDGNNAQYVEHVLQQEDGAGVSDGVTMSSVTRSLTPASSSCAVPYIIHVQHMKSQNVNNEQD